MGLVLSTRATRQPPPAADGDAWTCGDQAAGAQDTIYPAITVSHPDGGAIAMLMQLQPPLTVLGDVAVFLAAAAARAWAATRVGLRLKASVPSSARSSADD